MQFKIDFIPGGSVNRKTPQLSYVNGVLKDTNHGINLLSFARRTYDGDTFRHHDLVTAVRVQVSGTHEASLRGMRMYPTKHHEVFSVDVIEEVALVQHLAGIRGAFLLGYDQL